MLACGFSPLVILQKERYCFLLQKWPRNPIVVSKHFCRLHGINPQMYYYTKDQEVTAAFKGGVFVAKVVPAAI